MIGHKCVCCFFEFIPVRRDRCKFCSRFCAAKMARKKIINRGRKPFLMEKKKIMNEIDKYIESKIK